MQNNLKTIKNSTSNINKPAIIYYLFIFHDTLYHKHTKHGAPSSGRLRTHIGSGVRCAKPVLTVLRSAPLLSCRKSL